MVQVTTMHVMAFYLLVIYLTVTYSENICSAVPMICFGQSPRNVGLVLGVVLSYLMWVNYGQQMVGRELQLPF